MQKPWFRLPGLVLLHLLVVFAASAQSGDPQARDREWKSYKLPPVEFARYVDPTRVVMFRVPKDWQQAGFRRFKGPQGSELALVIEKIPDGAPLASLTNGVLQSLRGLPGADETFTLRHTEISTLEAREVMFSLVDPAGLMTRRLLWFTVSGPNAVSFVLIVPEASAAEVEPYFKAIVESAFVFESDAHGKIFEDLRAKAIKTDQPSRITELRELTTTIAGFDSEARSKAIARLSLLFNSAPDSVVDLLIDRRSLVRGSAVEALGRSSNKTLDGFLLLALADPSADVAVRAARTLAGRDDVVKLLRDDSAGWSGLQVEKVMRAIPMLDDRARAQIIRELAGDPKPRISIPRLAPPPPPSAGSAKRPAREQPSPKIKTKPPMILGGVPGGLPGGVPRGLPGRDFTEEAAAAAMLPDFDAITSVLPPNRLLDSTTVTARMAMTFALESRGKLPVASLLKLLADEDAEVGHLAALNLAVSANSADIARIEDFAKGLVTISGSTPGEGSTRRSLKEELGVTVKKIRWRERFLSATAESREAIVKETFEDSELAGFAFAYAGDAFEPAGPKKARPLPERATALDGSRGAGLSVSSLGANALPERVTLYAAIPDAQALVDKLARSFSSIQLESARNQANLLLMLKGIEAYLSKMFDAPPNAAILESSGVKPNSALVAATWTASGAPRGQKAAERKAVIARVADRDRFEHLIATYQKQIGRFDRIPEFISLGARLLPMLPALLPLGASAMTGSSSPRSDTPAYVVMGYSTCGGYPLTVIERRKMEWMTFSREPIYIAYVGDAAIMAPDLLSLQDCLRRLESSGPTLASNDEFKRIAAAGGDVIYMSDPVAAFNARSDERLALTERGGLRITNGGWESSFDVGLSEREWLKPEPFRPMNLKAPAALLPRTTVAYLVAKLDFATAWRRLGRFLFGKDSVNRFESVWALDFEREVLPELGPECGAVLLGVPKLTGAGLGTPSALFIQTKTDKLARAFADGTLLKGSSPSRKAVRVKLGANDYWFAVWNGFLVIAENEAAIDQLESSEHLSASRDFQKSASQARGEVIAFGGVNIEAAAAGLKLDSNDPLLSLGMTTLVSLARAFHSQSFYITLGEGGLAARMSVSLDREGRFSISDLASVSKEFQFAAAEVEAHGAPIDDQKRLDSVTLRISSKAPGAIERLKDDIESPGQVVDKRSDSELIVTIERRRPNPDLKVEIPVKSPEMEPFLKPAGDIKVGAPTVVAQAREIAGQDRAAWTVARKLADWTFKNLKWKRVDFADAAKTLATREADCLEFSELFVSMARSLGLPARIVTGLAHTGGSFGGHAWVEVWVGEWVQLDPTWGTNFVDATHIKSASSELVAYSALNAIGLEVVKTTRAIPEFQKSPTALAEALCNEFNNGDEEALAVALDPAFLVDSLMGDGAWAAMSAAERDQIYSARRRLAAELADAFSSPWKGSAGVRVLQVKQEGDRAEAAIISLGSLSRIYLGRKGESWFVRECRYEDLAYSVIEEDLRPTLLGLEAKRKNAKPPQIVDSAESRVLQARDRDARQAVQIAEAALKEAPTSKTLRYLKAVCLLQTLGEARAARQEEAVRLLDELAGEKPVFVPALRELAEHYAGADRTDPAYQSQLDKAIDLYQRYAALVPEDPRPHEAMGLIYDDAEDLVHAEAEYRKLVALDPLDPSNYSALAGALFKQSRHKEALAVIDESKGRGADREEMFANLFFELSGEPENARLTEELALAAPERLAKNFRANVNLALVRIESGRFADALPLLRRAVDLDPKSAEPHCSMANAFRKLRNWTAALKSADLAIKLDPEDPESHFHRACALAQMRRPAEAIAALKKAVELDEEMEFTEGFEKEEDLKPLASSPAFKKLVKETTAEEPPAVPRKDK